MYPPFLLNKLRYLKKDKLSRDFIQWTCITSEVLEKCVDFALAEKEFLVCKIDKGSSYHSDVNLYTKGTKIQPFFVFGMIKINRKIRDVERLVGVEQLKKVKVCIGDISVSKIYKQKS